MDLLSGFHQGSIQLEHINRLFMVLIPKKLGATMVDALRPICLQNCSIKILAKTLMISKEIGRLIDLNQTGFLSGRSISETFVFVAEVVQACHKHKFLHWSWSSTLQRHLILWIGKTWTAFYKLEGSPPSGEIGYKPSLWRWDQLSRALDFLQKRPWPGRLLVAVPFPGHWHPLSFAQKFTFWPPRSYWSGSTLSHAPKCRRHLDCSETRNQCCKKAQRYTRLIYSNNWPPN